jgi:hypothetical protein
MSTIGDLETRVQDRLEEIQDGVGVFWSLQQEIRPALVEGLNAAMLITGEPQIRKSMVYTIPANTTLQDMPPGALALLRVEAPNGTMLKRQTLFDMDRLQPGWQKETGPLLEYWFPYGLKQFGTHPKLTAPQDIIVTYVGFPVPSDAPYTGTETVPFQAEYDEGFVGYASHILRLKEGGNDFQQSMALLQEFMDKMQEMSRFALKKGALRFSRSFGSASRGQS